MMSDIILRAPEPEDLEIMLAVENDPLLWEHSSENTGPYTRYQMKQYIAENTNDIFTDRQLRMMIELQDGRIAGMVDVVLPEFRGRGIAKAAISGMEAHCFGFIGINQLYSYVRNDNVAARSVFDSCGFTEVAVLKSWIRRGNKYYDVCLYQKIAAL